MDNIKGNIIAILCLTTINLSFCYYISQKHYNYLIKNNNLLEENNTKLLEENKELLKKQNLIILENDKLLKENNNLLKNLLTQSKSLSNKVEDSFCLVEK